MKALLAITICSSIITAGKALAVDNLEELDALEQLEYQLEQDTTQKQLEIQESEINFKKVDDLKKYDYYDTFKPRETEYTPKQGPRFEPRPFYASLKAGAILHTLDGKQTIVTPMPMYVLAEERVVGEDQIYLYNQKKQIVYETDTRYIVPIEADLDMDAKPKIFKIESPKEDLSRAHDKKLKTLHYVSFHTERTSDPFSAEVFSSYININRNKTLTANATALDYQGFLPWKFPVDFGFELTYVSGSWKEDALGMHWKAVHVGPLIQKNFEMPKVAKNFVLRTSLSAMKSLFFNIKSDEVTAQVSYSTITTRLGFEGVFNLPYGVIGIGPNLALSKYSLESADRSVRLDSKKETITTLGLAFLYSFEVNI